jgi:L-fucose mutarotase
MILHHVTHPELLDALSRAGHGSTILIADGNYPLSTHTRPDARRVWLNVRPGLVDATTALQAVLDVVPIEGAAVMSPGSDEPPIFSEFRSMLPGFSFTEHTRAEFYEAARGPELALAIATGEQRLFGNILLTVGVVQPSEHSVQPSVAQFAEVAR